MIATIMLFLALLQAPVRTPCVWGTATEVGSLDHAVSESSGMAVSRRFPNRSYRINDSGDSGRFFVMDLIGGGTKKVNIAGFSPVDTEDMALGPCGDSTDCLFIGDIGDNSKRRQTIELLVVEERANFPAEVQATHRVRMRYPDGPHDAEALGVHPDGSVYITTKEGNRLQIYRLKRDQWRNSRNAVEMLEPVVSVNWPALRPNTLGILRAATAMDISPDGKKFLLLNYADAMEFFVDLSTAVLDPTKWKEGVDYRIIALTTLEQEEGIAYLPDGRSLLYDTERTAKAPARIMRMDCR